MSKDQKPVRHLTPKIVPFYALIDRSSREVKETSYTVVEPLQIEKKEE